MNSRANHRSPASTSSEVLNALVLRIILSRGLDFLFLLARKHGLALFDPNWTSVYSVQAKSSLVNQSTSRKIRISFGKESVAINREQIIEVLDLT
jgi:hypothetical protein